MVHTALAATFPAEIIPFRPAGYRPIKDDLPHPAERYLLAVLDQLDHGVICQDVDGRTQANRLATQELAEPGGPLMLRDGALSAVDARDASLLTRALREASTRQRRRLLEVRGPARSLTLSVVPALGAATEGEPVPALVMLPRSGLCSTLATQWFASTNGLSAAESHVLSELLSGRDPAGIAISNGVAISTVRTQICSIKAKTSTRTLRHLLILAARLPPLVPVAGRTWA